MTTTQTNEPKDLVDEAFTRFYIAREKAGQPQLPAEIEWDLKRIIRSAMSTKQPEPSESVGHLVDKLVDEYFGTREQAVKHFTNQIQSFLDVHTQKLAELYNASVEALCLELKDEKEKQRVRDERIVKVLERIKSELDEPYVVSAQDMRLIYSIRKAITTLLGEMKGPR